MRMSRALIVLALVATVGLAGCSQHNGYGRGGFASSPTGTEDVDLVSYNYAAADALLGRVPWLKERREPLLVASFVNINNMNTSSAFGRMVAEQVGSRFAQQDYTVMEMKLRSEVYIEEGAGEFALSRSVKDLSRAHNAAAVIAGTYAVGKNSVYVSARLIRATDSLVLAAYDYALPLGPDTRALVRTP